MSLVEIRTVVEAGNVPVTAVEGEVSVGKAVSVETEAVGYVVDC